MMQPSRSPAWLVPAVLSVGLGGALLLGLLRAGDLGTAALAGRLATSAWSFPAVFAMTLGAAILSARRWQILSAAFGAPPPLAGEAVGLTLVGGAFAQVLPVALGTAAARGVGTRLLGRNRSPWLQAGATLCEQGIDVLVLALAGGAAATTVLLGGAAQTAAAAAVAVFGLAILATRALPALPPRCPTLRSAWLRRLADVLRPLAAPGLAAQLLVLSAARIGLIWFLLVVVAGSVDLRITPWQIAAALPLGFLAGALLPTPAGIGGTEWGLVSALVAGGVPPAEAIALAVVSRLLSAAAALLAGASAAVVLAFGATGPIRRAEPTRP